MQALDEQIEPAERALSSFTQKGDISVSRWFVTNEYPSRELTYYLHSGLLHVHADLPSQAVSPNEFYRGLDTSWECVRQQLDVRRRVTDDILLNGILDKNSNELIRAFLLKGHAGSGKDVTLRRVAYEAAVEHDELVFWLDEGTPIRLELLAELYQLLKRRITLFINDVTPRIEEVSELIRFAKTRNMQLGLIVGARTNEWNVVGAELVGELNDEFELRDLSENDIRVLLKKLEQHDCLGHLKSQSEEDRVKAFVLTADRQLLVALHEATSGRSFETLVLDEYNNIVPAEAKLLYLDVSTLHRLNAPARAGLISRVSGVTFTDFSDRLLRPLEHVVKARVDPHSRDYVYRSRHRLIAKFVFEQVLPTPEGRCDQITRMLRRMNVDYRWDADAFGQMIRGRELAEIFADKQLADRIYEAADEAGASESTPPSSACDLRAQSLRRKHFAGAGVSERS